MRRMQSRRASSRSRLSRSRRLIGPEVCEHRLVVSSFLDPLLPLALYEPWEPIRPRVSADDLAAESAWVASWQLGGRSTLRMEASPAADTNDAPTAPEKPLRQAEQYRALVRERLATVLEQLLRDEVQMTRHEWLNSSLVSQLAKSFALERFTAFHFSVVHGLTAEGSASSLSMLDGGEWNNPPVASQDFYGAVHGQSISVSAPGVLENDYDPDYDALQAVLVNGPSYAASFSLGGSGSVTYVPPASWAGSDSFSYKAFDGTDYSEEVAVYIYIGNTPVITTPDTDYIVLHDRTLVVPKEQGVLANDEDWDGDEFWAELGTSPAHAAAFELNSDGSFTYTPTEHWTGGDSFTYYAWDGISGPFGGRSGPVDVTISVVNTPPVAAADIFYPSFEQPDQPVRLPVLTEGFVEDPDEDRDDVIITEVTQPTNGGEAWIAEDAKSIWYRLPPFGSTTNIQEIFTDPDDTPMSTGAVSPGEPAEFSGFEDQFYYTISDGIDTAQTLVQVSVPPAHAWSATKLFSAGDTVRDLAPGYREMIEHTFGAGSVGEAYRAFQVWNEADSIVDRAFVLPTAGGWSA